MRGPNKCAWMAIGHSERYSKSCSNDYCGFHNVYTRRNTGMPKPCSGCGVGTQTQCQLCKSCGATRVSQKLRDTERRAWRIFTNKVLPSLLYTTSPRLNSTRHIVWHLP